MAGNGTTVIGLDEGAHGGHGRKRISPPWTR